MEFKEAFKHMLDGGVCSVEDTRFRIKSKFPPCLQSMERKNIKTGFFWEDVKFLDYLLYTLASDLWQVVDENK